MRYFLVLLLSLAWQASSGLASTPRQVLMITAAPILQHSEASGLGSWSFGGLTLELAKAHWQTAEPTAEQYNQFIRGWLQNYADSRPGIEDWLTCAWAEAPRGDQRCRDTLLDPAKAPFKLLAISYRPDLAEADCQGGEGEFRFTFGLTEQALRGQKPHHIRGTEMTLILEYALHKAAPLARNASEWARTLLSLSRDSMCQDFCPNYQDELKKLSRSITHYNPQLESGSALGQIRSNEVVGDPAFNPALTAVLRQFGEVLNQCYSGLTAYPEDLVRGLAHCRQELRKAEFANIPIQLAAVAFDKALAALQLAAQAPLPVPIPTALVNAANNTLANISAQLGLWEMREFQLKPEGLLASPLHDTPSMTHNNSAELRSFLQTHADEILSGQIQISQVLEREGSLEHEWIAAANPFDPWRLYALGGADPEIARDARLHSHFASKTCQGCHSTQTTANGLFMVLNDLLLHTRNSRELRPQAAKLLRAHQNEELHIANIDAFYLISPLRDPGHDGQQHLAPFLTRKGGQLERLERQVQQLAKGCSSETN